MRIHVNGRQIDVGSALRLHVEGRLAAAADKYAERAVDAHVTFSREGHAFKADASMHLPTGVAAQAASQANEIYAAFDSCAERLEKQLRRYKRKLKDHHKDRPAPADAGLAAAPAPEADTGGRAAADGGDGEESARAPLVIADTQADIPDLSVRDAAARLEAADLPFLMFRNKTHGGVNAVFRRDDGNIGWIDPEAVAAR